MFPFIHNIFKPFKCLQCLVHNYLLDRLALLKQQENRKQWRKEPCTHCCSILTECRLGWWGAPLTAVFRARCSRARAGRENPHQSFETSWENCQKPVSQPTPLTDLGVMGGGKPRVKKDLRSHCAGPTLKIHLHRLMRTRDHLSLLLYCLFGALEGSKTAQLH